MDVHQSEVAETPAAPLRTMLRYAKFFIATGTAQTATGVALKCPTVVSIPPASPRNNAAAQISQRLKSHLKHESPLYLLAISFDAEAAARAAELMAQRKRTGRPVEGRDTMIAGIVLANRATLATRNAQHFSDLSATVINPCQV
jgi:predicted nucleic acid-binding protein